MDMVDAAAKDRQLQEDNSTADDDDNSTVTEASVESSTEEEEEEECVCPPEVVSTFTATLTVETAEDLTALDFDSIKTQLMTDHNWGESVVMVPEFKVGVQYTLDVDITEAQCKAAVAAAFSIAEDDVECGDAASAPSAPAPASPSPSAPAPAPAPAPASGPAPAPAPTPTRRLRRLTAVKAVSMSFADAQAAASAATASQDTAQFTAALADEDVTAVVTVSAADISVELMFTVTADARIEEPTAAHFESAVSSASGGSITVTANVSGFEVGYTRMPCSESDICDAGGFQLKDDAHTVACEGAECTVEERERCCNQIGFSTGGARDTCVLGSILSVLIWQSF